MRTTYLAVNIFLYYLHWITSNAQSANVASSVCKQSSDQVADAAFAPGLCGKIFYSEEQFISTGGYSPRSLFVTKKEGYILGVERNRILDDGRVVWYKDSNHNGKTNSAFILSSAPALNHGLVVHDGYIYASSDTTVYRWPYLLNNSTSELLNVDEYRELLIKNVNADWFRQNTIPAVVAIQAHSAPLGITFYKYTKDLPSYCPKNESFSKKYDGDAFIAVHGSWNRDIPTGYKVVRIPMTNGLPTNTSDDPIDIMWHTGTNETTAKWPSGLRPVDVKFDTCGRLIVSSDGTRRSDYSYYGQTIVTVYSIESEDDDNENNSTTTLSDFKDYSIKCGGCTSSSDRRVGNVFGSIISSTLASFLLSSFLFL